VKWTCDRSEAFLSDYQGRDLTVEAELALDENGKFLAVRGSNLSNLGGHAAAFVSLQKGLGLMSNVYQIPVGYFRGRGAVTNTVSTTPYRSAGRPPQTVLAIDGGPVLSVAAEGASLELGGDRVQIAAPMLNPRWCRGGPSKLNRL
jgi:carbon-monoxide dehydrogenase large subunit